MNASGPGSAPVYKRLYAFREMVADAGRRARRGGVGLAGQGAGQLRGRRLPRPPRCGGCHGDAVWRLRAAGADGGWAYVLVLVEFQSSNDVTMALRVLEYTALLYRELLCAKAARAGRLPPVLPVVLCNGESPWRAARDVGELIIEPGPALAAYQPSSCEGQARGKPLAHPR